MRTRAVGMYIYMQKLPNSQPGTTMQKNKGKYLWHVLKNHYTRLNLQQPALSNIFHGIIVEFEYGVEKHFHPAIF